MAKKRTTTPEISNEEVEMKVEEKKPAPRRKQDKMVVNTALLNVREKPDLSAPIVDRSKRGLVLTIVAYNDDKTWGQRKSDEGWVALQYCTKE